MRKLSIMLLLVSFAITGEQGIAEVKKLYELSVETRDENRKKELRQKIINLSPQSEYGLFSRAWFKEIAEAYSESEELYNEAIVLNPKLTMAYLNRGRIRARNTDIQGAISDFTSAKDLEPNNSDPYSLLCIALKHEPDRTVGMQYCNKAVDLNPKSILAYYARSGFKLESGDSKGAIKDANAIIQLSAKEPLGWEARGIAYITINNLKAGCSDLSKSGELGNTDVYNNMKTFCK